MILVKGPSSGYTAIAACAIALSWIGLILTFIVYFYLNSKGKAKQKLFEEGQREEKRKQMANSKGGGVSEYRDPNAPQPYIISPGVLYTGDPYANGGSGNDTATNCPPPEYIGHNHHHNHTENSYSGYSSHYGSVGHSGGYTGGDFGGYSGGYSGGDSGGGYSGGDSGGGGGGGGEGGGGGGGCG